jgi:uncharacterized membrane protein HdeD (DUF308 family)
MRRRGPIGGLIGFLLIVLGVLILFALVLPPGFWWFLIGMALICAGFFCACRR